MRGRDLLIGWDGAVPDRRIPSAPERLIIQRLSRCWLPSYDKNVVWAGKLHRKYLKANMVNDLDCKSRVEDVMMKTTVFDILSRSALECRKISSPRVAREIMKP